MTKKRKYVDPYLGNSLLLYEECGLCIKTSDTEITHFKDDFDDKEHKKILRDVNNKLIMTNTKRVNKRKQEK